MLSNAYFLAKFRFDTAENEPAKNLQKFAKICKICQFCSLSRSFLARLPAAGGVRRHDVEVPEHRAALDEVPRAGALLLDEPAARRIEVYGLSGIS